MLYFLKKNVNFKKINIFRLVRKYIKGYYTTLLPLLSNELLWGIGDAVIVMVYGRLGQDFATAQSTYSVFSQFTSIAMCINVAASIMVGNAIGRKATEEVDYLVSFFRKAAFIIGMCGMGLMLVGSVVAPMFYNFSDTVNTYITQIFLVASVIELFIQ